MQQVSHQTVKLSKGRHDSPAHGACVMELASMLGGERFSDHPRSVDPTIAAFLRTYNDLLDDNRRQDLYEYASRVVGTAGPPSLAALRIERIDAWTDTVLEHRRWSLLTRARRRPRRRRNRPAEAAARDAISAAGGISDEAHRAILALVDELIALGNGQAPRQPEREPSPASLAPAQTT